jgi:branched-chain amino acid transport system permease protein
VLLGSYALGLGGGEHLFYGGAIVLAMLLMPDGLTGLAEKLWRKRAAPVAGTAPR